MDDLGKYLIALLLLVSGLAIGDAFIEHSGTSLGEDQAREVVGKLKDVEVIPGWAADNSLIVLEDGTRIQVKGLYSVYQPGMDVATTENARGVLYCLAELCRYRRD